MMIPVFVKYKAAIMPRAIINRIDKVIEAIRESQVGEVLGPDRFDESAYLSIHEEHYL